MEEYKFYNSSNTAINEQYFNCDSNASSAIIKEEKPKEVCFFCKLPIDYEHYKFGLYGFSIPHPLDKTKRITISAHCTCVWEVEEALKTS